MSGRTHPRSAVSTKKIEDMGRKLVFSLVGVEFSTELTKVDREKLYGSVEIEAFDERGKPASLQVLAPDGKTFIGKGGTANAVLTEDGDWIERKELIAVEDGTPIEPVESSFSRVNILQPATVEDYLSHIVKLVYLLTPADADDADAETEAAPLESLFVEDRIYKFPFSYRGGLEYDAAFLMRNDEGTFMIVGNPADLEYLSLPQAGTLLEPVEEQPLDDDELDFDLL